MSGILHLFRRLIIITELCRSLYVCTNAAPCSLNAHSSLHITFDNQYFHLYRDLRDLPEISDIYHTQAKFD